MTESLSDAFAQAADFVPRLLLFVVIVVVGWFVAAAVRSLVHRVLERFDFDRAVERGGLAKLLSPSDTEAADVMAGLGRYVTLLITLQLAFSAFGPNPVSTLLTSLVGFLPQVFVALIIVVIAALIATAARTVVAGALIGQPYGPFLARTSQVTILALGVIAALNQIGVATTVTTPVLVAVLATVGGVIVVGVGGGLVKPMQTRWEHYLGVVENEVPAMKPRVPAQQDAPTDHEAETTEPIASSPSTETSVQHPHGSVSHDPLDAQWRTSGTDALGAPRSAWQQDAAWERPQH